MSRTDVMTVICAFAMIARAANAVAGEDVVDATGALDPTHVVGKWRTHGDGSLVNIQPCGESVCGILEWFPALDTATGEVLDTANQDEALRTRPLKGIQFIYGFKKTKKGWRKGRIYDPESGKTYKSKLTRIGPKALKVEGCVGPVCRKYTWQIDDTPVSDSDSQLDTHAQPGL